MRIFFDTEFIEDGRTIELISIGMVRADGVELYLESSECDLSRAGPWVQEHVLPKLRPHCSKFTRKEIAAAIVAFVEDSGSAPEFWADYAAYDWVVLCQLFGDMMKLPPSWPRWCRDLQQVLAQTSDPDIVALAKLEGADPHNALGDARDCKLIWEALNEAAFNAAVPPVPPAPVAKPPTAKRGKRSTSKAN